MSRPKRVLAGAKRTSVYISGEAYVILATIEVRRRKRKEGRDSANEIIEDALQNYWVTVEKMSRKKIEDLVKVKTKKTAKLPANVTQFPSPK